MFLSEKTTNILLSDIINILTTHIF